MASTLPMAAVSHPPLYVAHASAPQSQPPVECRLTTSFYSPTDLHPQQVSKPNHPTARQTHQTPTMHHRLRQQQTNVKQKGTARLTPLSSIQINRLDRRPLLPPRLALRNARAKSRRLHALVLFRRHGVAVGRCGTCPATLGYRGERHHFLVWMILTTTGIRAPLPPPSARSGREGGDGDGDECSACCSVVIVSV